MAIEIVDLPSYKMVDLSISYVNVYQRVPSIHWSRKIMKSSREDFKSSALLLNRSISPPILSAGQKSFTSTK